MTPLLPLRSSETIRAGSATPATGRTSSALTKLKIAVVDPIPIASMATMSADTPGARRSPRHAMRIVWTTTSPFYAASFQSEGSVSMGHVRIARAARE